jgi:hypothetical protein
VDLWAVEVVGGGRYEQKDLFRRTASGACPAGRRSALSEPRCLLRHLASENDGEWPDEHVEAFGEIISGVDDDPERALAYVVLASSRTDDAGFLALMGCGPLEDLLRDPSEQLLQRVVAEGRRSDRFRWLLSHPFKVAIAPRAWAAIEKFRITGPHEEPSDDTLPPRG